MVKIRRSLLWALGTAYSILFVMLFISTLYLKTLFILGGYPGLLIVLLPIIQLYKLDTLKTIIFGWIGAIPIGYNIIICNPYFSPYVREYIASFYLSLSMWGGVLTINFILVMLHIYRGRFGDEPKIRGTILELGRKYARLEVREISEKSKVSRVIVIDVIKQMIENNEIYAEYFSRSKTIAFNKQENIAEIEHLLTLYKKWEEEQLEKD